MYQLNFRFLLLSVAMTITFCFTQIYCQENYAVLFEIKENKVTQYKDSYLFIDTNSMFFEFDYSSKKFHRADFIHLYSEQVTNSTMINIIDCVKKYSNDRCSKIKKGRKKITLNIFYYAPDSTVLFHSKFIGVKSIKDFLSFYETQGCHSARGIKRIMGRILDGRVPD